MKRFLLRLHRERIVPAVKFCSGHFGCRSVLVVLAVLIGILAALATSAMQALMIFPGQLGETLFQRSAGDAHPRLYYLGFALLPFAGLALSFLVQHLWGGPRYAKSLSPLILALNRHRTSIPLKETVTHILSSSFAVGCGGSAGMEAPSVLTGAAIGANTASLFGIERSKRNLLIGCGAAAAISAIFNSPIGGVLFAVEVLLPEFRVSALVPMLISSAVATVASRVLGASSHLSLPAAPQWQTGAVPFYFLCGAICALVGVYVIRCAYALGGLLKRSFPSAVTKLVAGGASLCLLLALFPVLRGQGYRAIEGIFHGNFDPMTSGSPLLSLLPGATAAVLLLIAAIFVKVVTSVLTVDSGGDGGIFAPSLFIGAFTGFAFARAINLTGLIALQEPNFVIVGMCGVFTAVIRAPMTGIFLVAEVTGSYILLVPLMIVSAVSWCVARLFEPNSIYRKALIENKLLYDDRDRALLQRIPVRLCLSADHLPLAPDDRIAAVNELAEKTTQKIFPVLNPSGVLQGVIRIEKIITAMLDRDLAQSLVVFDLMEAPHGAISTDEDLAAAMARFERYDRPYLPVYSEKGKFAGFIFKDDCLAKYRALVREGDGA